MTRDVFLSGQIVDLTVLTEEDARRSNWSRWFNDPASTRFTQHGRFPNSVEKQVAFWRDHVANTTDRLQLGIVPKGADTMVGVVSLYPIDLLNRKAEINIMIGEAEFRRINVALDAVELLVVHAFENLNLNRIYGGSLSREWCLLLMRAFGFREEGVLREDVFKGGEYRDVHCVGLMKREFRRLHRDLEGSASADLR